MSLVETKLERGEKEADELWNEVYGEKKEEVPEVKEEVKEETEEPVETTEEKPPEPEVTEEPAKEVPVKEVPIIELPKDDWKQKYQTLEGKYRVEVPRLTSEVNQWKEYSTSLSHRITELENAVKKPVEKEPEKDADIAALETDYPDFTKVLKKIKDEHRSEIAALRQEIGTRDADIKNVKEDVQVSRQDRFNIDMARVVGENWREIDTNPDFITWLGDTIPYTRMTKLQYLQEAARNLDVETVSKFFLDYKETLKEPEPETEPEDKLKKFTAPPRSETSTIPKTGGQQGLSRAQYEKFMNPRYKFNPSDWGGKTEQQMEAAFDVAIQKGTLY
jgi:hypothetical protein